MGAVFSLCAAACSSATDSPVDAAFIDYINNGVDRPEITITLTADPTVVSGGDTVLLVARAHNSSNQRVQIGVQCGPAMDVLIREPSTSVTSALQLMVGPNGAFTCELAPYHFAEAHDSLTNRLWWVAPARPGEYLARAGARGSRGAEGRGFDDMSAPVTIVVH
jgi:hypothetical protein